MKAGSGPGREELFSFAKAIGTALLLRRNYSDEQYSCEAKLTVLLVLRSRIGTCPRNSHKEFASTILEEEKI